MVACLVALAVRPAAQPCLRAVHRHHAALRQCRSNLVPPRRRAGGGAGGGDAVRRHRRRRVAAEPEQGAEEPPPSLEETVQRLAQLADLNRLQTALNAAIAGEDWDSAIKLRDLLRLVTSLGSDGSEQGPLASDWQGLGGLGGLADRAESLGFNFPTGALAAPRRWAAARRRRGAARCGRVGCTARPAPRLPPAQCPSALLPAHAPVPPPAEVQKRAAPVILDGDDCILQSETGSGKTLAFLLPALSLLSYPPTTYPDDLKGPQALVVVPTRELGVQVRGGRAAACRAA